MKFVLVISLFSICIPAFSQEVKSFGLFGGVNVPFTIDEGLRKDPRFFGHFTFRGTPIGFSYGYDKIKYGYLLTPSYTEIGQKFTIVNNSGGTVGTRDVRMNYFSLPIAFRLHVNDIVFVRLSLIAALNFSYLLKGQETISISNTAPEVRKLNYPSGVSIPQDPNYVTTYNGVIVPAQNNNVYVSNDKFSRFQIFAGVGIHSDFDLNDKWSINFDGRVNYGILDPRTSRYINQLKNPSGSPDINSNPGAPDLYGQRRDIYLSVTFGISRILRFKTEYREKNSKPLKHTRPESFKPLKKLKK